MSNMAEGGARGKEPHDYQQWPAATNSLMASSSNPPGTLNDRQQHNTHKPRRHTGNERETQTANSCYTWIPVHIYRELLIHSEYI